MIAADRENDLRYVRRRGTSAGQGRRLRIAAVRAAAVTNPRALGRGESVPAEWQREIDHMNPHAGDGRYAGHAARFVPPWGELICVVTADDGAHGIGFGAFAGVTVPLINDYLAPMLRGEDAGEVERLSQMMIIACGSYFGAAGLASHAISPVDLALWDLRGKRLGEPVHRLVSADRAARDEPIPCYATGIDVEAYRELGFAAVKLPCEWGADRAAVIERTVARLERARSVMGDEAALMLDCWGVQDADGALAVIDATAGLGLAWVEDYLFPEDWPGYRSLRSLRPDATLAAGERWYTDRPFAQAVAERWVDVVQPDVLWVGGATPTIRIADVAREAGTALALHCGANDAYGQHLAYGLAENLWAEMYMGGVPDEGFANVYRSTPGMAVPVQGRLEPSDAPGFGVELTLDTIEHATR
jgi:L-rhamnonate dehydratase